MQDDELAARFSVGVAAVNRLLRRHRETGELLPKPHCGAPSTTRAKEKTQQSQRLCGARAEDG